LYKRREFEVNLKVEFVLWNTSKHGKILDVFAITFMMEMTKNGKLAAAREFQILKIEILFLVIKMKVNSLLNW